jgi:hypothetical protein
MVSSQLRALDAVLLHTQEIHERRLLQERLDQMALDLERSRMAAEDARGQTFWFSGDVPMSWRDYAVQSNQMITQLTYDTIESALVLVEDAAVQIRGGHANVAYNRLQVARRVLAQEEDSEDDGGAEEASDPADEENSPAEEESE